MSHLRKRVSGLLTLGVVTALVTSCSPYHNNGGTYQSSGSFFSADYSSRMPAHLDTGGKKVVLVDPNVHAWGAYDADGSLVRAGIATAGGHVCPDSDRSCHTAVGHFRIYSLGDSECISHIYPKPHGGGLMPYCMYFSGGMAMHGSPDGAVVDDNISHGCVRMRIQDAEWMRYNFASIGTQVIVKPY